MPTKEILVLAVTKMLGGVCIAGMTVEPDPITGLRWVRPIREHGHVLLGDITTLDNKALRPPISCAIAPALSGDWRASAAPAF
jgi:hypothetical protein